MTKSASPEIVLSLTSAQARAVADLITNTAKPSRSLTSVRDQILVRQETARKNARFIDHLEKALMRIENKTYGICRVTGKLIDKARLRAVPHATLSIEAKQMMNK